MFSSMVLTRRGPHPASSGWGRPISKDRLAELETLAEKQRAWAAQAEQERGESHFNDMRLTGADVFWLAAMRAGARYGDNPERNVEAVAAQLRDTPRPVSLTLRDLHLEGANLIDVYLKGADLSEAHLEGAYLSGANLKGADLREAHLERAVLSSVHLELADLSEAHLEEARLSGAHLEGADLREAQLEGAFLRGATLDGKTNLIGAWVLDQDDPRSVGARLLRRPRYGPALVDLHWGDFDMVQLTQMQEWDGVTRLADEYDLGWHNGLDDYRAAVRAYRQVSQRLRDQGFSDIADRLSERAQNLQRKLIAAQIRYNVIGLRPWRLPGDISRYLGSAGLALLAGYGYRPFRTIVLYAVFIAAFAAAYFAYGTHCPVGSPLDVAKLAKQNIIGTHVCTLSPGKPMTWNEAFVVSFTAFHGRGFFATTFQPGDPQAGLAAAEAVLGLLIEISFIATFTQRFFAR